MIPSTAPATIIVATSLEDDVAKELLSFAINILSHPNDTIIALHLIVGKEPKKLLPKSRDYKRFRRAKSFVLSVMGEFANNCQYKQADGITTGSTDDVHGSTLINFFNSIRDTSDFVLKDENASSCRHSSNHTKETPRGSSASFDHQVKVGHDKVEFALRRLMGKNMDISHKTLTYSCF